MRNIKECEVWLDSIGIAHGPWFAAPRGMWNFALGLSLEELGFDFSSDFGYDIDSFPFFPRFRGRKMKLLQIPIHPYSVERDSIFCDEQGASGADSHLSACVLYENEGFSCTSSFAN